MVAERDLIRLIRAVTWEGAAVAGQLLAESPELARDRLERSEEFFLAECHAQLYAGDTALHAAAFSYNTELARQLLGMGADIRARNRRGAEPIHAAVIGSPGSSNWDPQRQRDVIACLIDAGADPNATAAGGVTPLHRAVRNRCSTAVGALLAAGADPRLTNDSHSTALTLAQWSTGRSGSGSPAAKAEQAKIIRLLSEHQ